MAPIPQAPSPFVITILLGVKPSQAMVRPDDIGLPMIRLESYGSIHINNNSPVSKADDVYQSRGVIQ